jgi:hypothetical protein
MKQRAHLSFGLSLALILVPMLGCGDDDDGGQPAGGTGGTGGSSGGSGGGGGQSANAGSGGSGDLLEEGSTCTSDRECSSGLECMQAAVQGVGVRVCARPCTDDPECNGDVCGSPYTRRPQDAHCINIQQDQFGDCGPGHTAVCDPQRVCLYFPDVTIGVCVNLCSPDGSADSDAGAPIGECQAPQACIEDIVATPDPSVMIGVCGTQAARNDVCGIEVGGFCGDDDLCAPDDPEADESPSHCRENCSTSGTCVAGTCTSVTDSSGQLAFRYCKQ